MPTGVYTRTKLPWNKGKTGVYSDETLLQMRNSSLGQVPPNKGKRLSAKGRENLSRAHLGQVPWNRGVPVSDEVKERIRQTCSLHVPTEEARRKQSEAQRGWFRPNKRRGITNTGISGAVLKEWRVAVFTRDEYTCQKCGERGGRLEADHIIPKWGDISLIYMLENGRTLCKKCHEQTDTYQHLAPKRPMIFQIPLPMVIPC